MPAETLHRTVSCYTGVEVTVQCGILSLDLIRSRQSASLACGLQASVWCCLAVSACPWRTSCKEGDSNADTSQKAALPKHRFAFFGWDYSIRALIHPLSTEDPSTKMFCRMKSRSCKKMHPFEVLSFTGLGGFFSSFPRKVLCSHQNATGKWRPTTRAYLKHPLFNRLFLHKWTLLVIR